MEILLVISAIVGLVSGLWYLYDKARTVEWTRPSFSPKREEVPAELVAAPTVSPSQRVNRWPDDAVLHFPDEVAEAVAAHFPDLRFPVATDVRGDWALYGDPQTLWPLICVGDFTGSKAREYALFLLHRRKEGYKLMAFTRDPNGLLPHELVSHHGTPTNCFVRTVTPGNYRPSPIVQKHGAPPVVRLKRDGINFGQFEVSDSIFYWDKKKKAFAEVWMSD